MSTEIQKHLDFLGMEVEDRATGARGICTTVSFDLYGCVQAAINQGITRYLRKICLVFSLPSLTVGEAFLCLPHITGEPWQGDWKKLVR